MPNISKFNQKSAQWDYNIKKFSKIVDNSSETIPENIIISSTSETVISKLNLFDIAILREWMMGAGPRKLKSEILENLETDPIYNNVRDAYPINRQYLDERFDYLHPNGTKSLNLIKSYGIRYDRSKLMLHNHILFTGSGSFSFLKRLANAINQNSFPFYSTFSCSGPKESSEITEWLYKNVQKLKTYIISGKPNQSIVYPIYHNNFISNPQESGGLWNMTYDYSVTNIINQIILENGVTE